MTPSRHPPSRARRSLLRAAALLPVCGAAWSAGDPAFPSKTLRIVVPYPAGGTADAIARVYASKLADTLGRGAVVVVENKPGASGTIGADAVVRADADGHTLLLTVTSQLSNVALNVKPNYDPLRDFTGVVGIGLAPLVLAVRQDLAAASVKDLAQLAKSRPLAYGSYGIGTSQHVMLTSFARRNGISFIHAPYRGESPLVTDLLGGQLQFALLSIGIARELQQSGKVRLLAIVGAQRSEFLPKVPTFGELGVPGFDWTYGVAVYTSAKVQAPVLAALEQASQAAVRSADVQGKLRAMAIEPWGIGGDALKKRLVIDSVLWNRTLAQVGPLE